MSCRVAGSNGRLALFPGGLWNIYSIVAFCWLQCCSTRNFFRIVSVRFKLPEGWVIQRHRLPQG